MSPNFTVILPRKSASGEHQQTTLWYLEAYKSADSFYMCLLQGSREDIGKSAKDASKILVSDCTFQIVNLRTGEAWYKENSFWGSKEQTICNGAPTQCGHCYFSYSKVGEYSHNGTLVVQVEATIFCLSDPDEYACDIQQLEDNVLAGNTSLLTDTSFSDVTIKCGDAEFKAHKAILASQSPVFKKMLESDMKEQRTNVIEIYDVDQAVISDMLAYFYTGRAPHIDTLVKELLDVADKYELLQLLAMCENKLKSDMNIHNVIELLILADMHNFSRLKIACLSYVYHNSDAVQSSSQWQELKKNCDSHASLLVELLDYRP